MALLLSLACLSLLWDDPPTRPQPSPLDLVSAFESVMADAIARAEPSVVAIHRYKKDNPNETLAIRGKPRPQSGLNPPFLRPRFQRDLEPNMISFDFGSGVVVGDEGQILTAFHVVRGAANLIVRAADRQEFEAEIIAADPRSDLAVIVPVVVPGLPAPRLKPITLGDAGQLRKGSFLLALGNPFNAAQDGRPSASWGILSNVARRVDPDQDDMSMGSRKLMFPNYPTLLQLDSKLNLGMSGGAVLNLKGELVGLTTMASSPAGFDAMAGYAIPMDKIGRRAVETLREGKEIEYGFLGVKPHLNSTNRVEEVSVNSPADQGQLAAGDEILAVDQTPVVDFDSLILAINSHAPGDEVKLKLRRAGQEITKTVVLAKYFVDAEMIATNRPPAWRGLRVDYQSIISARALVPPPFLEQAPAGVLVTEVQEDSPAARAGLKNHQIIRQVEKTPVLTPPQFARAVAELKGPVTFLTDQGSITVGE
jgi:serine protease Do